MYRPAANTVDDPDLIAAMIRRSPFATLVTHDAEGFFATHLPLLFDPERNVLEGHIARANPHPARSGQQALAVFTGPHAYVSPSSYPSKAEHGRVAPTWNYEAVHVVGRITWYDDPVRLRELLDRLTEAHEAGRPAPWAVDDAPEPYVQALLRGIVGLEIAIDSIEAKRKLSQNKDQADRLGTIAGLRAEGAHDVADLMQELETA